MTVPASFAELATRIHERSPRLTPAHQRLAEWVLQDPAGVAFLSVAELAELATVNVSTVSRFAQSLGLAGYPALRQLCKQQLWASTHLVDRLDAVTEAEGELWQRSASSDRRNVGRTLARIDPEPFQRATTALAEAPTVHILGLRQSYSAAYLLWYLLQLVREEVRLLAAGTLVDQLRQVRPSDAFVAIAVHRYARDTVTGCQYAHRCGATTLAITDSAGSPLLPIAHHAFLADTTGPAVLRSMTAVISLVQAIAGTVAAARGPSSRAALSAEESLLSEFHVYHEPAPRPRRRPRSRPGSRP